MAMADADVESWRVSVADHGRPRMYVGVMHTITDQAIWEQRLQEFEETTLPQGFANPISYIGSRTDYAFCLWEVPSVEALQPLLDGMTAGAATNTYFPVDPDAFGTAGIPTQRINLDAEVPTTL